MFKKIIATVLIITLTVSIPCVNPTVHAKSKKHIITFNAYNGTFSADVNANKKKITLKYKHNKKRGYAPSIKRSNYVFNGWYTKKKGGKKYTSNTKIKKTLNLYPHWLKAFRIDTYYYELLGKPFESIKDIEKKTGQLKRIDKWEPGELIYTSTNGDKYHIVQTERFQSEPIEASYYLFYIVKIECKAKNIVDIKKSTKYSTFMKKLKTDWMYYHKNIKNHSFSFTCGITTYWYTPSQFDKTVNILWYVKMKSNNQIAPNTYFTLTTTDFRQFDCE